MEWVRCRRWCWCVCPSSLSLSDLLHNTRMRLWRAYSRRCSRRHLILQEQSSWAVWITTLIHGFPVVMWWKKPLKDARLCTPVERSSSLNSSLHGRSVYSPSFVPTYSLKGLRSRHCDIGTPLWNRKRNSNYWGGQTFLCALSRRDWRELARSSYSCELREFRE